MRGGVLEGQLCGEFAVYSAREMDSVHFLADSHRRRSVFVPIRAWSLRQGAPS